MYKDGKSARIASACGGEGQGFDPNTRHNTSCKKIVPVDPFFFTLITKM